MTADEHSRGLLADSQDALLVVGTTLVAIAGGFLPPASLGRAVLTLPLLLVLPGYALTTVLFPAATDSADGTGSPTAGSAAVGPDAGGLGGDGPPQAGLALLERLALSFGLSVGIVPLLAIGLWIGTGDILRQAVSLTLGGFVVLTMALGIARRRRVPAAHRYAPSVTRLVAGVRAASASEGIVHRPSARGLLQGFLAVGLVFALGSLGLAILAPTDAERYTDFALLTETGSGELAATGYPAQVRPDGSEQLTVSVENLEGRETTYSVVVLVGEVADGSVQASEPVQTYRQQVASGENWRITHDVSRFLSPAETGPGSTVRLTYLLYRGEPPAEPSSGSAYRSLHLTVEVGSSADDGADTTAAAPAESPGRPTGSHSVAGLTHPGAARQ